MSARRRYLIAPLATDPAAPPVNLHAAHTLDEEDLAPLQPRPGQVFAVWLLSRATAHLEALGVAKMTLPDSWLIHTEQGDLRVERAELPDLVDRLREN